MIEEIKKILIGIDQTELENPEGWWETSAGAEFGANKLKQIAEALAQPEQEPVAWSYWQSCLNDDGTQTAPWVHRLSKFKPSDAIINKDIVPLYTTPPQPWEKFCDSNCVWTDHHPDCKLAEQEPVACVEYIPCCTDQTCPKCKAATPPQRKPLTDEEIENLYFDKFSMGELKAFARAIEAAHGIKENK